jgi:hypothetical protein
MKCTHIVVGMDVDFQHFEGLYMILFRVSVKLCKK